MFDSYQEGDPDRPFVTALVSDPTNPTPYTLPDNKTRMVFRSHSYKSSGNNEMTFEDITGAENQFFDDRQVRRPMGKEGDRQGRGGACIRRASDEQLPSITDTLNFRHEAVRRPRAADVDERRRGQAWCRRTSTMARLGVDGRRLWQCCMSGPRARAARRRGVDTLGYIG